MAEGSAERSLVWFRGKDLRLGDHAPLRAAARQGEVVPLFVFDPYFFAPARARELPHRMQFLLESVTSLASELERRGSRLFLAAGKSALIVPELAREWRVTRVVAQRWSEPFGRLRDARVAEALHVPFELFDGETLAPPESVRNGDGRPYSVFTPFARAHRLATSVERPWSAPATLPPPPSDVRWSDAPIPSLSHLGITPNPALPKGGEPAARARLTRFLSHHAADYEAGRDRMDRDATSRLSVDLHFGTLSARKVWVAAERVMSESHPAAWRRFSDELLWREFTHAVLWDDPSLLERPHRRAFEAFPWETDDEGWRAWRDGTTGYPVVDASARQLLGEGFVHNRARMISASFLTKDLRIDYRRGEAHYLTYLLDGDWAQNNFGWQWTAGCGFDAAPYFRVFNPVEQGKRFDPTGDYVRRWVPELARMPEAWIHEPWRAPDDVLRKANVALGTTYPRPIVDHREARTRYLATMAEVMGRSGSIIAPRNPP
jgi:deoxyribodipyrimidine photo-lyase